ncbi:MAG: PaaI family thioesterase [Clostridiales bacterium]|nr:PaaI family thioesterase [Clostridiales bacterium]
MKVVKKQRNSINCIICGMDNNLGVKAPFYEMEDGSVYTIFRFKPEHQSYPGRVHGGLITAMLDELAGRVLWVVEPETYAVTTSLEVRFRKPVPYDVELKGVGVLTKNTSRAFEADGKIYNMEGELLASAVMKYMKLPKDVITGDSDMDDEMIYDIQDGVTEIN